MSPAAVRAGGFRRERRLAVWADNPLRTATAVLPRRDDTPAAHPVLLAVGVAVTTAVHTGQPPDPAGVLAAAEATRTDCACRPPAGEWAAFLARLPAGWEVVRERLAAWGTPPEPPAELRAADEYAARVAVLTRHPVERSAAAGEAADWLAERHNIRGLPPLADLCPIAAGRGYFTTPRGRRVELKWDRPNGLNRQLGLTTNGSTLRARHTDRSAELEWKKGGGWSVNTPGDFPVPLAADGLFAYRPPAADLCGRWGLVGRLRDIWQGLTAPALPPAVGRVEAAFGPGPRQVAERLAAAADAGPAEQSLWGQTVTLTPRAELPPAAHAAWRLAFAARAARHVGKPVELTDALAAAGPADRVGRLLLLAEVLCVALFTDGLGFAARWTPAPREDRR